MWYKHSLCLSFFFKVFMILLFLDDNQQWIDRICICMTVCMWKAYVALVRQLIWWIDKAITDSDRSNLISGNSFLLILELQTDSLNRIISFPVNFIFYTLPRWSFHQNVTCEVCLRNCIIYNLYYPGKDQCQYYKFFPFIFLNLFNK